MTVPLSREARDVFRRGTFCLLAAFPEERVHLTPVVYVLDGDRVWLTTSRNSIKARTWRRDPRTAGLVEAGGLAVAFRGRCRSFDLLDPSTWAASAARSPLITRAAARFSMKNARFFAGYARDAHRVPLSWTPPARVFSSIEIDAAALLGVTAGAVLDRWGTWEEELGTAHGGDAAPARPGGVALPEEVAGSVGDGGEGALGMLGSVPAVIPCRWRADEGGYLAAASEAHLRLAGPRSTERMTLTGQRPSAWRAREMRGFMAEGTGSLHRPARTRSGRGAVDRDLAAIGGAGAPDDVLVRLRPERLVWWSGWTTGTVTP